MMNDLNSVLFEGALTRDPVLTHDLKGNPRCLLAIASKQMRKGENGMETRTTEIIAYAEHGLAESCAAAARKGRQIKVVGSLAILQGKDAAGRDTAQMAIEAAHFELRPELTMKPEKKPSHDILSR
jgi:single-strand DNA-binding protein